MTITKLQKLNDQWQKCQVGIKSFDIESKILYPSCLWGQKITQDINPIYGKMDKSCPKDSKNLWQSWTERQTDRVY